MDATGEEIKLSQVVKWVDAAYGCKWLLLNIQGANGKKQEKTGIEGDKKKW